MFEYKHPVYFIRDPEIIKKLTIKEFDHFTDHRLVIDEEVEPLFAKGLFGLTGQKWKGMRSFNLLFLKFYEFFDCRHASNIITGIYR